MPDKIGKHLLGRIPSPPDERDYRLENFLGLEMAADPAADASALVDEGLLELKKTTVSYPRWAATMYPHPEVTHWWMAFSNFAAAQQVLSPPPAPPPAGGIIWSDPDGVLDQGNYGTCVGNGCAQWGNTLPVADHWDEKVARAIYYEATILDGAPDDPDAKGGGQQGATVRSGVKALKNRGRIATYAAASSTDAITYWLQTKGSVIIGSNWTDDMFTPDDRGFVHPTGSVAGGHCYLIDEWQPSAGYVPEHYGCLNSWGASWGDHGRFRIFIEDFGELLAAQGEAWAAVELAL